MIVYSQQILFILSFDHFNPAKFVRQPPFLNAQDLVSDLVRDGANQGFIIVHNIHLLALVLDLLDSTDDHSSSGSETFKQLPLLVSFEDLLDQDLPLAHFVLLLVSQQFLHSIIITRIESRVIPGRIRSLSSGVTTYISPDLESLKIKKMFDAPTSTI